MFSQSGCQNSGIKNKFKCQNHFPELRVKFFAVRKGMKQNFKNSATLSYKPFSKDFFAFAFSAYSACLNIEFWTYFQKHRQKYMFY